MNTIPFGIMPIPYHNQQENNPYHHSRFRNKSANRQRELDNQKRRNRIRTKIAKESRRKNR